MYIDIKLVNENTAQQESVAIAKVFSLVDKVVLVCMLCPLFLAQPSASPAHKLAPFTYNA